MKRMAPGPVLVVAVLISPGPANAQVAHELKVHVAQANNDSPYAFVRARFEPGEVVDPWAVRFFDERGGEIPYFVWDSVTWRVARAGKDEWGHRYALVNHAPGDAPAVVEARGEKLKWAQKNLPELGARLAAREQAADKAPDSVCAALYLLRHRTPALGKERLTLRVYPRRQVEPKRRTWKEPRAGERVVVGQGGLELRGLPDRLAVAWKSTEVFRSAGFQAGGHEDPSSHADPGRPFVVEASEGIITKVSVAGQTKGRAGGSMDWQCTYWLLPEGGFVGLEGFSLSETGGYAGGPQKLSVWQAEGDFTPKRTPAWETPWWLHRAGDRGFVATHLFYATPLTIGFGNNPFAVNAEGADKDPRVEARDGRLSLRWSHRVDDPAIARLMTPQPLPRPGNPKPAAVAAPWRPKVDWLHRQYAAGVGTTAPAAEGALRSVLGAAAGWVDRPVREEEVAALLVATMPRIATGPQTAELNLLRVVPALLQNDQASVRAELSRAKDPVARTDYYIRLIRTHVQRGGKPADGKKKDDPDGTPREGWTGNPGYHAELMPAYVRVLEHFDLPAPHKEYRAAVLRYADFSLELLGGNPLDFDQLDATCKGEWPSRIVPLISLALHAHTIKPDPRYARAARLLFDDLMYLVERNPHGYFPAWTFSPGADRFDTVYNPISYERGLAAFWWEGRADLPGRDRASRFVAAQARWLVFSGQLLDTLETDNATAIRASTHGGHTNVRNQIGIYLYDDFAFYRGLVGELVAWSAAASQVPGPADPRGVGPYRSLEPSDAGSSMVRWALGIRPGSKWLETQVNHPARDGFRLRAWNRLPRAKPAIRLTAKDVGLKMDAEVLQVQLDGPAYREPAELDVRWTADRVTVTMSRPAKLRLSYAAFRPDWPADAAPVLRRRRPGEPAEAVRDVLAEPGAIRWQAAPGEYELTRR